MAERDVMPASRSAPPTSQRHRSRVAVVFNADTHLKPHLSDIEKIGEDESEESAGDLAEVLRQRHHCQVIAVGESVLAAVDELQRFKPDFVFNLCESVLGQTAWEANFAHLLESLGYPTSGCDPVSVSLCHDKVLLKRLFAASSLPAPAGFAFTGSESQSHIRQAIADLLERSGTRRVIVKPSREDGGLGVDAASVCHSVDHTVTRSIWVTEVYRQPALIEEFVEGREFNQALFWGRQGVKALPPGEILFDDGFEADERIVGWKAKWDEGSREDLGTRSVTAESLDGKTIESIRNVSLRAAALLGLSGYCRFDLRERSSGEIVILDVNPNPDIGRDSGFRKALVAAGIEFIDFLDDLIAAKPF